MRLEFKIKNPKSPVSRSEAWQRLPFFPRNHFVLTGKKSFFGGGIACRSPFTRAYEKLSQSLRLTFSS